jgi:hypothetical protein
MSYPNPTNLVCVLFGTAIPTSSFNFFILVNLSLYLSKQKLIVFHQMLLIIQHSMTGLMGASSRGYTKTVSVLLAAKADPNVTDEVKLHYSHYLYDY